MYICLSRLAHQKTEYTFFSSTHVTFSRISHMRGHKTSLSKLKKIEILSGIFFDHNTMRLAIHYKKKKKLPKTQVYGG